MAVIDTNYSAWAPFLENNMVNGNRNQVKNNKRLNLRIFKRT